ncbi:hypothetical protein HA402_009257 [Bradysia odoriphaga]|nr:hypothetical protein HA402_009257 [Bradysia odoriphaga]
MATGMVLDFWEADAKFLEGGSVASLLKFMRQYWQANNLTIPQSEYGKQLPLQYGQSDKKRTLSFKYDDREDIFKFLLYVHSPEELPYFDMEPIFLSKIATQFALFETIEIVNSNEVRHESIDKRSCRFPDEKLENSVLPYSFSSCFTDKRIAIELNTCNCTLHTSPIECNDSHLCILCENNSTGLPFNHLDKDQYCDYQGLLCIGEAAIPEIFKESYKSGKLCVESCIEMQINNLGDLYEDDDQNTNATETEQTEALVVIEISNMPTVRYVRNVAKTRLDFVVAIGGLYLLTAKILIVPVLLLLTSLESPVLVDANEVKLLEHFHFDLREKTLNVKPGDVVKVIAPARKSPDSALPLMKNYVESLGLVADISANIYSDEDAFYSNTDEFRANDLISAVLDDDVKIIWCVRGGTGSIRLIPYLEAKLPAKVNHKILIGYSDITVLHLYFAYKYGWQTIQGPMLEAIATQSYSPTSDSVLTLEALIFEQQEKVCWNATKLNDCDCKQH